MTDIDKWTVVQHSAMAYAGDTQFERAVETAAVGSNALARAVVKAGGVVFDSYGQAADYEEKVNYPPSVRGLIPCCDGDFSTTVFVDTRAVYLPKRLSLDEAISGYETEKANVEAEQQRTTDDEEAAHLILKCRLNEIDTFLNVLNDMKWGH